MLTIYMKEKDFQKTHRFIGQLRLFVPGYEISHCEDVCPAALLSIPRLIRDVKENAPSNANRWRFATHSGEAQVQYGQISVEYYFLSEITERSRTFRQ